MTIRTFLAVFMIVVFGCLSLTPHAQARVKDSYYFMKDDGIFSEEEKDEEAEYVYKACLNHSFHSLYYDCGCVAGSFRAARDGELVPRDYILRGILNNPKSQCANTLGIAGRMYNNCISIYSRDSNLKRRGIDAQKMCSCYANKVAVDFTKKPLMKTRYIGSLQSKAYSYCRSVKGRQEGLNPIAKTTPQTKPEASNEVSDKTPVVIDEEEQKSKSLLPDFSEEE